MAVFTWCHTTIWRILFSLTKNGFFKLCHLTKNFRISDVRVTCAKCILVCFSATRKKRILLLRNFFKWTKVKNIAGISFWISNWERFVTNVRPHAPSMDFNKTAGPVEQCALVGRAHPLQFLQIQKTEEPNNRNYSAPSNFLTFRRPRPKFSILPLLMYSPGPAEHMGILGICPHLLLDRYVNPISTKGGKLCP